MGYTRTYLPRLLLFVMFAAWLAYILALIFSITGVRAADLGWPVAILAVSAFVTFFALPRFEVLFIVSLYGAAMTGVARVFLSPSTPVSWKQLSFIACCFLAGISRFICVWDRESNAGKKCL